MSDARSRILANIRRSLGPGADRDAVALDTRLANPKPGVVPAQGKATAKQRAALFRRKAEAVSATVDRLQSMESVPRAIVDFLGRPNEPVPLVITERPLLGDLPWQSETTLDVRFGMPNPDDPVTVTHAYLGIAETGTLLLHSGPESASLATFLPDTNIVILPAGRLVGAMEDAWKRLREDQPDGLPRAVHLVTGPSRTADIAQQLELGAHGPRRLHILLVGDG